MQVNVLLSQTEKPNDTIFNCGLRSGLSMLLEVIVMGKKKTSDKNSIRRKEKGEMGDMVADLNPHQPHQCRVCKSKRERQILYMNTYIWNLER